MSVNRLLRIVVAIGLGGSIHAFQAPPAAPTKPPAVAYEEFCGKTRTEKQDLFRTMTPAEKAALWQTQIERWRALNNARLTDDQRAVLRDFHAIIPIAVVRPVAPETAAKLSALETRLKAAFTKGELNELDNYGPCIKKGGLPPQFQYPRRARIVAPSRLTLTSSS
jgi:hypothetical protein